MTRDQHCVSRANISENALKVLYRLRGAGYQAYLVGGCVRDLLLGREPKDFDVATDALPDEIKDLFRNCRLVGRRFRLAHIMFGREVIEVATFRANVQDQDDEDNRLMDNGMIVRDNVYGTLEDDAWRRDFTVNALYYNIDDFSVVDYTGGLEDLKSGHLRIIGDPAVRLQEDPVRMLRAVRFAVKLGFRIEAKCEEQIYACASSLARIPAARLFEETIKLFLAGYSAQAFESLRHYKLFTHLFPATDSLLDGNPSSTSHRLLFHGLQNTDTRVLEGKPVTPAFLFAVMLWEPVNSLAEEIAATGEMSAYDAFQTAAWEVLKTQGESISVPRRFSIQSREIWSMQRRLISRGKRALKLVQHPRFRAAYDFLLLRAEAGEDLQEIGDWWTSFQEKNDNGRRNMVKKLQRRSSRQRRAEVDSEPGTEQ